MGKMKKLLVLLTVAVGLFGFSAGAFAAGLDDICIPCTKCPLGTVGCPQPAQGITPTCSYFDYETGYGYVPGTRGLTREENCKAIFSICNCLNAGTNFVAGHRIGIRMTILVDGRAGQNGAYWSQPASANIAFSKFATQELACAATAYVSQFGPGKFYKTDSNGVATTEVTSLTGGTTCTVPTANQATQIITDPGSGYTITLQDETDNLSRWLINIPEMRIDTSVLHNCETISVKIETLDQNTGGICAECTATCECIIQVAKVCCATPSSSTCLFPYFTSTTAPNDAQPWWNGIAIINTGSSDGTATLLVTQTDGVKGEVTVDVAAGAIYVEMLKDIEFTAAGGTLGDKPVWIQVNTTFTSMDGFAIIADSTTGESMGYLCRKPSQQ